jgi:hypothetical protein
VAGLLGLRPPAVSGPVLIRSILPPPTLISASEVESALSGFLRGSTPGDSGLCHSRLADILHVPSPQAAALASDAVTNFVNRLASGGAPTSFAPWLCGAPLTTLAKPKGGVRPLLSERSSAAWWPSVSWPGSANRRKLSWRLVNLVLLSKVGRMQLRIRFAGSSPTISILPSSRIGLCYRWIYQMLLLSTGVC